MIATTFLTRVEDVADSRLLELYRAVLSTPEQQQLTHFVFDRHRQEYLLAHALLRWALEQCTGRPAAEIAIRTGPYGKPELEESGSSRVHFSLTHTSGLVACVVGHLPVGIDLEALERPVDPGLAHGLFHPQEVAELSRLPDEVRRMYFLKLWTLKEAYIKGLGLGLHYPLDRFRFRLPDNDANSPELFVEASEHRLPHWHFHQCLVNSGRHILAIAANQPAGGSLNSESAGETRIDFLVRFVVPFQSS